MGRPAFIVKPFSFGGAFQGLHHQAIIQYLHHLRARGLLYPMQVATTETALGI
jgi:hypothetical protein